MVISIFCPFVSLSSCQPTEFDKRLLKIMPIWSQKLHWNIFGHFFYCYVCNLNLFNFLETLPIVLTLAKITWFFDVWHRNCRWLYEWNKVWKIFIGWSIKVNSCVEICKSYHVKIGKPCLTSLMWLHHQWVEIFGFWSFKLWIWKSSLLLCQYSVRINQSKFQNTGGLPLVWFPQVQIPLVWI